MTSAGSLTEVLEAALRMLAGSLPMLLAYTAALIIVITRWRVAPRVSLLALCGVLLGLFLVVAMPFVSAWMSQTLTYPAGHHEDSLRRMTIMYTVVGLVSSFVHALSFGFLFLAIYKDRRNPMAPPPPPGY